MTRRIKEDHDQFRKVVQGQSRKELQRLIRSGKVVRKRGKDGQVLYNLPSIDIPHIVFGDNGEGLGRGKGEKGKVVGKAPGQDPGDGHEAGDEHADGMTIAVDLEDVLKEIGLDLQLPPMKPKPNQTFEDKRIKYTDLSKNGPESLRHTRRTMKEALKRLASAGDLDKLHKVPGIGVPIKLITPINSDRRYRQYREVFVPSSNAVIFFARDCSGSMDDYKCDIVSDLSWWIDCWIRRYYKKVARAYLIHDTEASQVSEKKFYNYRHGGGTICSCVFEKMHEIIMTKYLPEEYNIYIFYYTDGENWYTDNDKMIEIMLEKLPKDKVNMIGVTQIMSYDHGPNSVKGAMQTAIDNGKFTPDFLRLAEIGKNGDEKSTFNPYISHQLSEDERNQQILEAMKVLLGRERVFANAK